MASELWTVVGVYEDGETFADQVEAHGPYEAMQLISRTVEANRKESELQIIGAIQTSNSLIPACDDERGSAAYACDLAKQ